jgi:S-adenosylmethionine decarboxylase
LSGAGLGQEWLVDASGCDAVALKDARAVSALFEELVVTLGLKVLGTPQWHTVGGPGGVTGLAMLSESHLAIHTFPEHRYAALSLYSCTSRAAPDLESIIRRHLHAERVFVRTFSRGET